MQYKIESVGPVTVQIPSGGTVKLSAGGVLSYETGDVKAEYTFRKYDYLPFHRECRTATTQRRARGAGIPTLMRRCIYDGRRKNDAADHHERRGLVTCASRRGGRRHYDPVERRDPQFANFKYDSSNDPRIRALERREAPMNHLNDLYMYAMGMDDGKKS